MTYATSGSGAGSEGTISDPFRAWCVGPQDELDFADPPAIVPTHMGALDGVLSGGMAPGVHVLMAQPGAGKSALALHVAVLSAKARHRVLFASTEMTRQQCIARCSALVAHGSADLADFDWGDWERMGEVARAELHRYQLEGTDMAHDALSRFPAVRAMRRLAHECPGLAIVDDEKVASVEALVTTAGIMRAAGMDLLVVDYLQRLRPPDDLRDADQYRQVSETSKSLASVARDLEVPVLVVSSMNREAAASRRGTMAGARGSGDVEYDAVTIWHLVRTDERTEAGERLLELNVMKNRRGPTTDEPLRLWFDPRHNAFREAGS